jgi:hypothetical protein
MGDQYLHYLQNPKYALENSDLARSDIGRNLTSYWKGHIRTTTNILNQYWHYTQYPAYAIENSDLAKSDLGRAGTHFWKHGCGALIFDLILLLTPAGAPIKAILKGSDIVIKIGAKAYSYGSGANDIASCYSSSGGYYGYGGGSFGN